MRNVWLLLRVQLSAMLGLNRILHLKDRRERIKKLAGRIGLGLCLLMALPGFGAYAYLMASGMNTLGQLGLFPSVILAANCMMTLIASVSVASGTLLTFKDYDLTMSLPVKPSEIAASRLLLSYVFNVLFDAMLMIPCGVVYACLANPAVSFYPIFVLTMLAAPVLPMIVGSLIGILVARLTASVRGAKYIQLLLGTVVMVGFMYFSMNMSANIELYDESGAFADVGGMLSSVMNRIYPLTGMYTSAVRDLNWGAAVLFVLIGVALLAAAALLLGCFLRQINTALTTTKSHGRFRMRSLKTASPLRALYGKEIRRYLSSTVYLFNTAFGLVLALVGAGALLVKGRSALMFLLSAYSITGLSDQLIAYVLGYIAAFLVSMSCTTSASISLEGKNLWLLQSMPLSGATVLWSKILVNLTLTVPTSLIIGLGAGWALNLGIGGALSVTLMSLSYSLLSAVMGLMMNLKSHNFEYTTDAVIIKRSAAVSFTILISMLLVAIPAVLTFVFVDFSALIFWLAVAVTLLASAVMLALMHRFGDRWIRAL